MYQAYKKRTKKIEVDHEEYNKMKEADPEFYREASSLQYGKVIILLEIMLYVTLQTLLCNRPVKVKRIHDSFALLGQTDL